MPVDWNIYRDAMRQFATGVAILTVRDGETIHGMTANAFTSVSKEPDGSGGKIRGIYS